MFDVSDTEYRVEIKARDAHGVEHSLVHVFAPIGEPVLIEFQRRLSRTEAKRNRVIFEGNPMEAKLWLWNKQIVSVEGYSAGGTDLMKSGEWAARVPPPHRVAAVDRFYEVWTAEDADDLADQSPFAGPSALPSSRPTAE